MPHTLAPTTAIAPPPAPSSRPIAHWTHSLALLFILFLTTAIGTHRTLAAPDAASRLSHYTSTMLLEWLLLGSVIAGIYNRRAFLLEAFAQRERTIPYSLALGVAVYCAGFIAIASVGSALYFTPLFHKRK